MKKIAFMGLAAALSLTALAHQRAAAQCCPPSCERGGEINFNFGFTFGCHWTPCQGHWVPNCPVCYGPPMAPYGYPPPPPAAYGYPGPVPAPPPPAAVPYPPAGPNPLPKGPPSGLQNVGYSYAAGYNASYGYNYMNPYGIPYFQTPDYWYGR